MRVVPPLVFVALALGIFFHFYLSDGLDGWFFGLSGQEATYYSKGYSDSGFRRIKIGMSERDVLAILGEPLDRHEVPKKKQTSWLYSGRRTDTDYRERVIIFKNGKVSKRISEYYVD